MPSMGITPAVPDWKRYLSSLDVETQINQTRALCRLLSNAIAWEYCEGYQSQGKNASSFGAGCQSLESLVDKLIPDVEQATCGEIYTALAAAITLIQLLSTDLAQVCDDDYGIGGSPKKSGFRIIADAHIAGLRAFLAKLPASETSKNQGGVR